MSRLALLLAAFALAACAVWYHQVVVAGLEAELAGLKMAYAQAQVQALANALTINTEALSEREVTYAKISDAGKAAAVSIAKAESKPGDVDLDGLVPVAVSGALLMQYERVCAGSVCGVAPGDPVQAEAAARGSGPSR